MIKIKNGIFYEFYLNKNFSLKKKRNNSHRRKTHFGILPIGQNLNLIMKEQQTNPNWVHRYKIY